MLHCVTRLLLPCAFAVAIVGAGIPVARADGLLQMRVAQTAPPESERAPAPPARQPTPLPPPGQDASPPAPGQYAPPPAPGQYAPAPAGYPPGYGDAPPDYVRVRPPSKGTGLIIAGSILTGLGGVWFLSAAALRSSESGHGFLGDFYFYALVTAGVLFELSGVPLLIVGVVKRGQYNAWAAQHPVADAVLKGVHVAAHPGGGGVGWGHAF